MVKNVINDVIIVYMHSVYYSNCYDRFDDYKFCTVSCLSLPPLLNGMITYNSTASPEGNTTATYNCNDGYMLIGESTHKCQSDITWSNTAPYCIGKLTNSLINVPIV